MAESHDRLERALGRLAPEVDSDAALADFLRQRTDSPSKPPWPALAAAVLVVIAVIAAAGVITRDEGDAPVATGTPDAEAGVQFDVLAVLESVEELGTLRAATTADEFDAFVPDGVAPAALVDFASVVVVSITIADDACPPDLIRFDRDGATVVPVFAETATVCELPLIPRTYLVAIDRDSIDPTFSVLLSADETHGIEERLLVVQLGESPTSTVQVDPVEPPDEDQFAAPTPPCAQIERFADQLTDVGITYDYTPTQSPFEVAERSDVVASGRLTGALADEIGGSSRVGYEVMIETLHKSPANVNLSNPITIYVDVGVVDAEDFSDAVVVGIPVVVMAEFIDRVGGERLFADLEGFATGCPGGPLLGFTGSRGEWSEIADLHGLTKRLADLDQTG